MCSWMTSNLLEWLGYYSSKFLVVFIPRPSINVVGELISYCERKDLLKSRVNSYSDLHLMHLQT